MGVLEVSCDTMAKACFFFVCLFCVFNKKLSKTQSSDSQTDGFTITRQRPGVVPAGPGAPWSPAPGVFLYKREKKKSLKGMDLILACIFFV